MTAKKATTKQPQKEVQLDLDPSEKIKALEDQLLRQKDLEIVLMGERDRALDRVEQLGNVIDVQSKDLLQPIESTTLQSLDLRTTMLMAMLPQVRIDYPRPDAQKAAESVDVIMEVWGLNEKTEDII